MTNLMQILISEALKVKVLSAGGAVSNALYPTSGNFVDVAGAHRFAIIGLVEAVNSAVAVQLQQADANNGTPKDITGALYTIDSGGADNGKWFIIEVEVAELDINNGYHFITASVSGSAGADDQVGLLYVELDDDLMPVTQADLASAVNVVG